jgi:hypothetical protein
MKIKGNDRNTSNPLLFSSTERTDSNKMKVKGNDRNTYNPTTFSSTGRTDPNNDLMIGFDSFDEFASNVIRVKKISRNGLDLAILKMSNEVKMAYELGYKLFLPKLKELTAALKEGQLDKATNIVESIPRKPGDHENKTLCLDQLKIALIKGKDRVTYNGTRSFSVKLFF